MITGGYERLDFDLTQVFSTLKKDGGNIWWKMQFHQAIFLYDLTTIV